MLRDHDMGIAHRLMCVYSPVIRPVPNYTAGCQKHAGVNNLWVTMQWYPVEMGIIDSIGRIEFTLSSIHLYGFSCKSLDTPYNNLEKNHIPANSPKINAFFAPMSQFN